MLIGVLSDTHSRIDTTRAAIEMLKQRKARQLFHCGDVGSPQILDLLAGVPAAVVWGNCDYDVHTLEGRARVMGIACYGAMGRTTVEGKTICFLHGDDHRQMQRILSEQDCDYLFHGHSHVAGEHRVGGIHVVNPGALHRATVKTVALVDTRRDEVEFLEVE